MMDLRKSKVGLFSERENTDKALNYAWEIIQFESTPEARRAAMTIAIMVYHNTLLEQLAKAQEKQNVKANKN